MKLFAIYIGGEMQGANIEVHDMRFVAAESMSDTYAELRRQWWGIKKSLHVDCWAAIESADGYARLPKLLPPPSRRGLVVIDPPFEKTDEFEQLAQALRGAVKKFATGIYLVWYPIKSDAAAKAWTRIYTQRAGQKPGADTDLADAGIGADPEKLKTYALIYAKGQTSANGIVLLFGAGQVWPHVLGDFRVVVPASVFAKYLASRWKEVFIAG